MEPPGATEIAAQEPVQLDDKLKAALRRSLGRDRFERWFSTLVVLEDDGEQLTIGVPNLFIREWIEQRYLPRLAAAVQETRGKRRLKLHVDGELYRRFRQDEAEFLRQRPESTPAAASAVADGGIPASRDDEAAPPGLNEKLSLDTFLVGPCNHVAYSACMEVLRAPGSSYNPLFIYAGSGLGKTHLLQGLTREFFRRGVRDVRYMDCERFSNAFVRALRERSIDSFRNRYHRLRVLVLDDLHILQKRTRTQMELLHAVDAITSCGGQVVCASDTLPQQIDSLQKQLQSRLLSGLVCRMEVPDYATRCAVLDQELARVQVQVPEGVRELIADSFDRNLRELIGALVRVVAFASLMDEPLTEARAREILADQSWREETGIGLEEIVQEVARYHGLTVEVLRSRARGRGVSASRQLAIYLARILTDHSLAELGQYFGGRNHATVNFSFRKVLGKLKLDREFAREVERLEERLKSR